MDVVRRPGAKWWKVDFHAHSPASFDFGSEHNVPSTEEMPYDEWLLRYMRAGIDAIIIADHNTHIGIDAAREALRDLEGHDDFRPLVIFAGAEVTTHANIHLLAVFDVDTESEVVNGLLHHCGYSGTRGNSDRATTVTFSDVVRHIHKEKGLAIPAHADSPSGLFKELRGNTLLTELESLADSPIIAMEIAHAGTFQNEAYAAMGLQWSKVLGSDAHHLDASNSPEEVMDPKYPGSHYTWVKMDKIDLAGLRLALHDEQTSLRRSDVFVGDPNDPSYSTIQGLTVNGVGGTDQTRAYQFGPWLNSVIGGRGTGKSTLVEVSRVGLGRYEEIRNLLKDDLARFDPSQKLEEGFWKSPSNVVVEYNKNGHDFRITWSTDAPSEHHVELKDETGTWVPSPGDVAERFPVRIYSQKQIYGLAEDSGALLGLVDAAPEIGLATWKTAHIELVDDYKSLCGSIRSLGKLIGQRETLQGRREDVQQKLDQMEVLSTSGALQELRAAEVQLRAIEVKEAQAVSLEEDLRLLNSRFASFFDDPMPSFSTGDFIDFRLATDFESRMTRLREAALKVSQSLADVSEARTFWEAKYGASDFLQRLTALRENVALQGGQQVSDATLDNATEGGPVYAHVSSVEAALRDAPELVRQLGVIDAKLAEVSAAEGMIQKKQKEAASALEKVVASRKSITKKREQFIRSLTTRTKDLKISVVEQGRKDTFEEEIRRLDTNTMGA